MIRAVLGAVVGVVIAGACASASTGTATPAAPIKAAWIYVGPTTDGGWTQAHDRGRLAAAKAVGSKVTTTCKENVPEGPQVAQVIEDLVKDGNKIIFATSYGFQDAMVAAAAKHPDVYFEQATGSKTMNLLETYDSVIPPG